MPHPIYNITPFTMLDYPGRVASIIWFAGCNMKCLYCYNPDIVKGKGKLSYDDALRFLHTRKHLLDGVVLSGGECTLHHGLVDFCVQVKSMGYLIKIDTNGTRPDTLQSLLQAKLIDYVALDFKAPKQALESVTGFARFTPFEKTLDLLLSTRTPFEVRTTYHSELLSENDLRNMSSWLLNKGYTGKFYIQNTLHDVETLGNIPNAQKPLKNNLGIDNIVLR